MTYEQAVALRTHQLCGHYVAPDALQRAIEIIQTTQTQTPWAQVHDKRERKRTLPYVKLPKGAQKPIAEVDMDAIYRRPA